MEPGWLISLPALVHEHEDCGHVSGQCSLLCDVHTFDLHSYVQGLEARLAAGDMQKIFALCCVTSFYEVRPCPGACIS